MPFSVCGSDHFTPFINSVTDQNLLVLHLQDQINRISGHVAPFAWQKIRKKLAGARVKFRHAYS